MRAARSEYDAPAVRTAGASDIGPQHPARHGQNDREIALGRKNHLFAGSDGGAARWAVVASLLATAKLNDVEPFAYLKDTLERMSSGHPMSLLDDLLPWNWASSVAAAA
jgi:transposase IS66-like protein